MKLAALTSSRLNPSFDQNDRNPATARRGLTLVECMVSLSILAFMLLSLLQVLIHSRRTTEESIAQASTLTAIEGYMEQMKSMDYDDLPTSEATNPSSDPEVPTLLDQTTSDTIYLSWGSPPATLPDTGSSPTGAVDNVRLLDINNTPATEADDLKINIWTWVSDLTGTATDVESCKAITLIYTWEFTDGARTRIHRNIVRSMRSVVPTF